MNNPGRPVGAGPGLQPSPDLPRWVLVIAVVLLAANLRTAVNVIGPLLPSIRDDLGLTGLQVGLLTALPTLCFAAVGALGPSITRRFGATHTVLATLVVMTVGQVLRAAVPGLVPLFAGTALALSAIAVTNVLMPSVVARFFPGAVATMTAAYTVSLAGAGALASAATLPVQEALGGTWQLGLGMWAAVTILAIVPWLVIVPRDRVHGGRSVESFSLLQVARSGRAWVLAAFFGLQALQAYVVFSWYPTILADAGLDLVSASAYVGLISLASLVGTLVVLSLVRRVARPRFLVAVISSGFLLGYAGTIAAPLAAPWLWTLLIGIGTSSFPLGLYLVTRRARTHHGMLALSGFMQSLGYLLAAAGLIAFGAAQGESTNWTPALLALMALTLIQMVAGFSSVDSWTIDGPGGTVET